MDKDKFSEARQYRIYPTNEQIERINDNIEFNREMWNAMLAYTYDEQIKKIKEEYKKGYKTKQLYSLLNRLEYKEQKAISKKVNKISPKKIYSEITRLKFGDTTLYGYTRKTMQQAFKNHFKNPKKFGMPRFKSYLETVYQGSYSTGAGTHSYFKTPSIFKLSKIGDVKLINHYPCDGRMFKITVIRKPNDTYYVSCFFEVSQHTRQFPKTGKSIGIDFNVDEVTALATSFGQLINRPSTKRLCERYDFENHKLGKKREKLKQTIAEYNIKHKDNPTSLAGFSNYQKNRLKVAQIQQRIRRIYDYWIKSTASVLVKNYDTIAIEDLRVSNLLKNHKLARSIARSHFRELRIVLEYKASWSNKKVVAVNPKLTTQTCSNCGYVLKKGERLKLADRQWTCPNCHASHVRDINAAKNILRKAVKVV